MFLEGTVEVKGPDKKLILCFRFFFFVCVCEIQLLLSKIINVQFYDSLQGTKQSELTISFYRAMKDKNRVYNSFVF